MDHSKAYSDTYVSLMHDVQNLITLHPSGAGTPGRPPGDSGPLLRSTVVLLHTAWENYVEQVATEGLDFLLLQIGPDHTRLHHALEQKLAAMKNPWALAGEGWKIEARAAVGREVGRLNTPNVKNTEALLELAFGFKDALHGVSWQAMAKAKVQANVDEFVHDIRGEIVHKGTTPAPLGKSGVESWITFFEGLVPRLDKKVGEYLESQFGTAPW